MRANEEAGRPPAGDVEKFRRWSSGAEVCPAWTPLRPGAVVAPPVLRAGDRADFVESPPEPLLRKHQESRRRQLAALARRRKDVADG